MAETAKKIVRYEPGHIPGNAVLTPQNAIEIRKLRAEGMSIPMIAAKYGISYQHTRDIVLFKKWRNAEKQV
jgi:DNA invertase Pin-like site-specific DNA recombinase